MGPIEGSNTVSASSQSEWRNWLAENHATKQSVWLIIYRKNCGVPSVTYSEAVDEAICFGWIDSTPNKRDDQSYYQFFAKRSAKSNWSAVNKAKVGRLEATSSIAPAGLKSIEIAKQNGTWDALEHIDSLVEPQDLTERLDASVDARNNWDSFPPSSRRGILEWIQNAKRPETRMKRINETAELAARNIKANHYRQ